MAARRFVVVSDLDGTLLDHDTYSADAVRPALDRLSRAGIPIVLSSSKTRAEIEAVQRDLGLSGAFISENGGGVFLPAGMALAGRWPSHPVGGYDLIEMGVPYQEVVSRLHLAAADARVRVRGFASMTADEVAAATGLTLEQARLAKLRDFGEPFQLFDADAAAESRLADAARARGLTLARGGRFRHASAGHDKGAAVQVLREAWLGCDPEPFVVAFGDGLNDAPMLEAAELAVIVRAHDPTATAELARRLPGAIVTPVAGPAGVAAVIDRDVPARLSGLGTVAPWPEPLAGPPAGSPSEVRP